MTKHESLRLFIRNRLLPNLRRISGSPGSTRSRRYGFALFSMMATIAVAGVTSNLFGREFIDPPAIALPQPAFARDLLAPDLPLRAVPEVPIAAGSDTRPLPRALAPDTLPAQLPELERAVSSYGYATSVGGIAFGRIATPTSADVEVASLRYDPTQHDGARLQVTLHTPSGDVEVASDIPDWLLVPIARFAGYNQCSAFTAFGKLADASLEQRALSLGYYVYNYHRAFEDSLLGFRLLEADMLIIRPESVDLPKEAGAYLLGVGEQPPDLQANTLAQAELQKTIFPGNTQPFRSYIITDAGQNVTFGLLDGKLVLDGFPYWHCWKSPAYSDAEAQSINDAANQQATDQLQQEYADDAVALGQAATTDKYTPEYQQARFEQLWDRIITPQMLVPLPDVSVTVSNEVLALGGLNPAVYDAITSTLRYAALFRRNALLDPAGYAAFAATLDCVQPEPWVDTPSLWAGSGLPATDDGKTAPPPGSCWNGGNAAVQNAAAAAGPDDSGCSCTVGRTNVRPSWAILLGLSLWLRRSARRLANGLRSRRRPTRRS